MSGAKGKTKRAMAALGDIDLTKEYLDDGWKPDQDNMFADLFAMAVMNFDLSYDPKRVVATLEGICSLMFKKYGTPYSLGELEAKLTQLRIRHRAFKYWRTIPGVLFDEETYQAVVTNFYWTQVVKKDEPPLFFHFHNNCCFLETRLHRIFEAPGVADIPPQTVGTSVKPFFLNETSKPSTSTGVVNLGDELKAPINIPDDDVDLVAIQNQADMLYGGHKMVFYTCDASGKNIRPVDDTVSLFVNKYRKSDSDDEAAPGYPEDVFPEYSFPGPDGLILPDSP